MFFHVLFCFVFFKQKTAYELRISDWSSDVCSSDLAVRIAGIDVRPRDQLGSEKLRSPAVHRHHLVREHTQIVLSIGIAHAKAQARLVLSADMWNAIGGAPDLRLIVRRRGGGRRRCGDEQNRSGEHTSELQSLMRISYAV